VRSRLLIRNWSAKNDALSRYLRNLRMISDKLKKVEEDLQSFLKKFNTNPNLKMGEASRNRQIYESFTSQQIFVSQQIRNVFLTAIHLDEAFINML
jgi:hypothetical protein